MTEKEYNLILKDKIIRLENELEQIKKERDMFARMTIKELIKWYNQKEKTHIILENIK